MHSRRVGWVPLSPWPACLGALFLLAATQARSQTGIGTVSSAPGGVPVPAVPSPRPTETPTAKTNPALANVFRVHVVDGRNGLSIDHAHLQLWYDDLGAGATSLVTNPQGVALMPAPVGTPVRVLVSPQDAIDCTRSQKQQSAPAAAYNLLTLAATGMASVNHCGSIAVKPKPGELILFVRPFRWYEGLNR